MKLKTYTASTMAQALAQVRKDLGTDAMILHTRSFRTGSWLGFGGKPMVEITASTPQPTKSRKTRRGRQTVSAAEHAGQGGGQGAGHEQALEHGPEIVVQRSRMLQPTAKVQVSQEPTSPSKGEWVDDRAALLQGLMGGVERGARGGEVSPIRDRRTDLAVECTEHVEHVGHANNEITLESKTKTPQPSHDDGFEVTTFRSITDIQTQPPVRPEPAVQDESSRDESHPEPLIAPGSMPEFEIVQAPVIQAPVVQVPVVQALVVQQSDEQRTIADDAADEVPVEAQAPSSQALQSQIDTLQKMMGQVLETTRRTAVAVNKSNPDAALPPVEMSAPLHAAYAGMIDNDVSVELADRFVGAVRDRLDADELGDAGVVRHALLREIEVSIQTVGESFLTYSNDGDSVVSARPHVIALVGPTGVGKTTTVAKIAATAKLRHGKRVALITSDTYRIAAVEQLKTYASIIGLELRIANNPDEMRSVIESLSDVDQIVIDTAGRSQNNHARLDELGELIAAARPNETHLVLSSTVGENVLRKTAERFMALGPDRCILTKLDEAVTTGMIAGFNERVGLPLSFVTVGQEVPDDILVARSERLARAVLDGPGAVVPGL